MRVSRQCLLIANVLALSLLLNACERSASNKTWQLEVLDPTSHQTHTITAADLYHRQLVINYWAEWCKPCREEIPELNRFALAHKDTVLVLGFNFDNLAETDLQTSASHVGITYPVLLNNPANTFLLPEVDGLPTTFLLDEHGVLKKQLAGPQTLTSLEAALLKP